MQSQVFPVAFAFRRMVHCSWGEKMPKLGTYSINIMSAAVVVVKVAGKGIIYYF